MPKRINIHKCINDNEEEECLLNLKVYTDFARATRYDGHKNCKHKIKSDTYNPMTTIKKDS